MKLRLFIAGMLLVVVSLTVPAQTASSNSPQPQPLTSASAQEATQPQPSLGVALLLPGGRSVAYAAPLPACAEKNLKPIPVSGYDKVSAIGIYPHLSGDKVAVRVTAMLTPTVAKTASSRPDEAQSPVGDYVIGRLGDSLKLTDLTKLGLPPLEVKVVNEGFTLICCIADNGLRCCGTNFATLCANCEAVCPDLFGCGSGAAKALPLTLDVGLGPANQGQASHKVSADSTNIK